MIIRFLVSAAFPNYERVLTVTKSNGPSIGIVIQDGYPHTPHTVIEAHFETKAGFKNFVDELQSMIAERLLSDARATSAAVHALDISVIIGPRRQGIIHELKGKTIFELTVFARLNRDKPEFHEVTGFIAIEELRNLEKHLKKMKASSCTGNGPIRP